MAQLHKITPCLWFDTEGEDAATFYCSVFSDSRITRVVPYGESDHPVHQDRAGTVMVVNFELQGQPFTALNGGPYFKLTEAVSFQITCETQEEVDYYWGKLTEGGDPAAQQCGWLKDRFGLSWQVVPQAFLEMVAGADGAGARRAMATMMSMKKLDIAGLEAAYAGGA